jgi:amino acid transporter
MSTVPLKRGQLGVPAVTDQARAKSAPMGQEKTPQFRRSLGLRSSVAINMTQMCGIGPFITIPLMVATMGGPQAIAGWLVGAALALCDGLVWSELGASMPGAGGTYLYLREAFQYRSGKLMPFLFVWTAMISIPLIMSTGVIGFIQYLGFYFPHLTGFETHALGVGITAVIVFALYRRISSISKLTNVMWGLMLVAVGATIAAAFSGFHPSLAFHYPSNLIGGHGAFFTGLGAGLIIAIYDYAGYNTTAYMGAELKNPGRVMPRSIIYSIMAIMALYLAMQIGVLGVLPVNEIVGSSSVASLVVTHNWSHAAADVVTAFILIAAFGSVFAGLLGGSRVPYHAAEDGTFFRIFGRLHPKYEFPYVALLAMGVVCAIGTFFDLATVIGMLVAVSVLLQSVAQIVAVTVLRRRQPDLRRPYRQWLYPLPSLLALAGWIYVFVSATSTSLILSTIWVVAGVVSFLIWARVNRAWPFGPLELREQYLEEQRAEETESAQVPRDTVAA